MKADILRKKFLEFFKSKKHKLVESDSLAPKDDPTVLFTPAGMNQFKKEFMGFDSGFKRAATSQRCLRTDDLDKVGKTSGHHTLFEMLGNFSFGDYFKKEAIIWAWEFLRVELKLSEDKLWVSVYKDDDEAYKIWRDVIKVPGHKIVKLGDKENFWPSEAKEKGPNGPCGPCSEIFFDLGSGVGCGKPDCTPACGCGRFLEIWNLVFTQFNRKDGGALEPLPNKNIDTGMGLERLAAVMQGVSSNFETDLFQPLIKEINSKAKNENRQLSYAVADHIRAITFSIYDGILPSNEARGYVVRKLIRKSVLHLRALELKPPYLYKLTAVLAQIMKEPYPELLKQQENIAQIILSEEKNFIAALDLSGELLKDKFKGFADKQDPDAAGRIAFQLHDTYGLPLELTQDWLKERGINISEEVFNKEMDEQKSRSKLQSAMKGDVFDVKSLGLDTKETKFTGYKESAGKAKVMKIIKDGSEVKKAEPGVLVDIVLDETPFYPESGGQAGDTGVITKGKNILEVTDTKKFGKSIVHIGKVKAGSLKKGDMVNAAVDPERRLAIARNHTATHLLQAALRKVLGPHVQQQGSLVEDGRLRFDFTHFKDIDAEQLDRIEEVVNGFVIANHPVDKKQMTLALAKKEGALAFFGEKYESKVRVISVEGVSKELCGGIHLDYTGQIGLFKILQEGSIASGVRRIEAATGTFAYKKIKEDEFVLDDIVSAMNVPPERLSQELQKKNARIKDLERQISSQQLGSLKSSSDGLISGAEVIKGVKVITNILDNLDINLLRKNIDLIKEKTENSVIALGSSMQGKAFLVVGLTPDLAGRGLDAVKLIREIAGLIGGSGGGRQDFAQAGGNNPDNLQEAFQKLKEIINNSL